MAKASKKGQKIWVLILYIVVLLGLLAGFLIPMDFNATDVTSTMLIMQIPDAINKALGTFGVTWDALSGVGSSLAITSPMGISFADFSIDINAWLTVLYALFTVIAVICVIPAIVGCTNRKDKATRKAEKAAKKAEKKARKDAKKGVVTDDLEDAQQPAVDPRLEGDVPKTKDKKVKQTTFRTAFAVEGISVIILFFINLMIVVDMQYVDGSSCLPVAIAFAVVIIVGFIQRIIVSKGSGVIKFILFILSLAAVFTAVFCITSIIPSIQESVATISGDANEGSLLSYFAFVYGGDATAAISSFPDGLGSLCYFLFFAGSSPLGNLGNIFVNSETGAASTTGLIWFYGSMVLAILVLVNCFLDMLGIYKKTNKFMLGFNVFRFTLEIADLILLTAILIIDGSMSFGFMFVILAVIAVIQWIIDIIRVARYKKAVEMVVGPDGRLVDPDEAAQNTYFVPAMAENPRIVYVSSFAEPAYNEAYHNSIYDLPAAEPPRTYYPHIAPISEDLPEAPKAQAAQPAAAAAQPAAAAPAAQPGLYNLHTIYNGPTDKFISTLTNDEKVEFARVFLERANGELPYIHEYRIGCANDEFFTDVIIHFTLLRDLISDGLMMKLYKEDMRHQQ
ncbi:MAG: hypothetical protein LUE27_06410 [Clostridia bacterium]|nr:hypothetical protein [Clostridia bacterium]